MPYKRVEDVAIQCDIIKLNCNLNNVDKCECIALKNVDGIARFTVNYNNNSFF